jgi:formylglycine-generating enzyme
MRASISCFAILVFSQIAQASPKRGTCRRGLIQGLNGTCSKTAVVVFLIAWAAMAHADNFATTINQFGSGGGGTDSVYGWSFIPNTDIYVTNLGVLDYNSYYHFRPWEGLYHSHPIGIWSSSAPSNLLVSTTIPSGTSASLVDYVRFKPVTPTLLRAGTEYVIGAYYPTYTSPTYSDSNLVHPYNGTDISLAPELTFVKRRWLNYTSGLKFPSQVAATGGVEVGPTFQFVPVPEPSTLVLLAVGGIAMLARARRRWKSIFLAFFFCGFILSFRAVHADVFNLPVGQKSLELVTVGDPGNAPDSRTYSEGGTLGRGAVGYAYAIGKYEITNGQYVDFLNAVAVDDAYGLYTNYMFTTGSGCKISRAGNPGAYSYSIAADRVDRPVNHVSLWDAFRFCNWLQNGQPKGNQNASTTEDGAYPVYGYTGSDGRTILRNPNAKFFIPSVDEWYKAAYYKGAGTNSGYWSFATQNDADPSNLLLNPDPGNNANFRANGILTLDQPYYMSKVGEFSNSISHYGTFDQTGNALEWTETIYPDPSYPNYRMTFLRGGSWSDQASSLKASMAFNSTPTYESFVQGFRIAALAVPEPSAWAMLLTIALGGLWCWKRR